MNLQKEVQQLETNIFQLIEASYAAIAIREYQVAKLHLTALEALNEEYKGITQRDCVKPQTVLNLYERLWEKQNA
jgi:hypothetical protein